MSENKAKFTVVDAVIILIVIAAVIVGVKKLLPSVLHPADQQKISFTVLLQREDESFADAITVGDKVTISLTEKDGGVVTGVTAEPAKTLAFNSMDGTYANQIVEGKEDVFVTIEADVSVTDLALKAGGTPIKVGADIPVRGKGYASTGYVIDIED